MDFSTLKNLRSEENSPECRGKALDCALEGLGSVKEERAITGYITPEGNLKMISINWDLLDDGRYNLVFFSATTTFKVAPNTGIFYHTLNRDRFLSSRSTTTVELRSIPRHIEVSELRSLAEDVIAWSTFFVNKAQEALTPAA